MAENAATAITKPSEKESWVQSFVKRAKGEVEKATPATAAPYVKQAGSVLRSYGEAAVVGSLLGAAESMYGLDHGVPVDGVVAAIGALVAIGTAEHHPGISQDARTNGAVAFGYMLGRKTKTFLDGKRGGGSPAHGETSRLDGGPFKEVGPRGAPGVDPNDAGDPVVRKAEEILRRRKEAAAPR